MLPGNIIWSKDPQPNDRILFITNPPLVFDAKGDARAARDPVLRQSVAGQISRLLSKKRKSGTMFIWVPVLPSCSHNRVAILLEECYLCEVVLVPSWGSLADSKWLKSCKDQTLYLIACDHVPRILGGLIDHVVQDMLELPAGFPPTRDISIGENFIREITFKHMLLSSSREDEDEQDPGNDIVLILGEMAPNLRARWMASLQKCDSQNVYHVVTIFEHVAQDDQIMEDIEERCGVYTHNVRAIESKADVERVWKRLDNCCPRSTSVIIAGNIPLKAPDMARLWSEKQDEFEPRVLMDLAAFESTGLPRGKTTVSMDPLAVFGEICQVFT